MRNRLTPIAASFTLILAMLACSLPPGPAANQPNLVATITAQALALQAAGSSPAPADTPLPGNTAVPTNTVPPPPPPKPADTAAPTAPSKPKSFKADGSAAAINFSWSDTSLDETGFRIYQDGVTAPVGTVGANAATGGVSYNWSGLSCGFKGKFSVRAYSDNGESGASNSVAGVTIPCQPGNLTVNPGQSAISFNWSVAASHNEDGFRIYQQGVSAPVGKRGPNLGSGGTIFDLTGLHCNLVATFYVTAFNSAGESPGTNLVQSESVPCGPSNFTITSVTKDKTTYSWTDNATSETGFHVYIDDVLYATLPPSSPMNVTGTLSNDAALQCDFNFAVNHVYSIKAFNYAGESNSSEHVGASTPHC